MVRRGVAARASRMEGSLLRLRTSVISTFLIAAVISIMAYVVTRLAFDSLLTNLLSVNSTAQRAVLVQQGVEQVQEEVLSSALFFFFKEGCCVCVVCVCVGGGARVPLPYTLLPMQPGTC